MAGCLLGIPLVAVYYLVAQVPQLGGLFILMNVGVEIGVSGFCAWMMLRRTRWLKVARVILPSVMSSVVIVTIQYALLPGWGLPLCIWPFWGAALGAIGFGLLLLLQGPKRRRQSAARSRQVSLFLHRASKEWMSDKQKVGRPMVRDEEDGET